MSLVWEPDAEDLAFHAVYGAWQPLTPEELQELMEGFAGPWWLVGGHAIEAFTGVRRAHEDVDLVVFSRDADELRAHLGDRLHLWCNHGGTFRVLDDEHPQLLDPLCQIWMRENAQSPWLVDCILNPDVEGRWQSRRYPDHVADLEEVTWVDGRGIRFGTPELVLSYKAKHDRTKDRVDLEHTLPLLDRHQRAWLAAELRRRHPGHTWLSLLEG